MRRRQFDSEKPKRTYKGRGVTINWHTTSPTLIQTNPDPLKPNIIPLTPTPKNNNNVGKIIMSSLIGATAVAGSYAAYKYMNNQRRDYPERQQFWEENEEPSALHPANLDLLNIPEAEQLDRINGILRQQFGPRGPEWITPWNRHPWVGRV